MPAFKTPMINLYSRDLARAAAFYSRLGFVETFRTPAWGEPVHIELTLDGFTLGIATVEAAKEHDVTQRHTQCLRGVLTAHSRLLSSG
ncbi:MAG TPA: VOC family protein [Candidatus Acidoferrum sp.]|nr:VOC family protein [Candidatus Acidoferrum sp.]